MGLRALSNQNQERLTFMTLVRDLNIMRSMLGRKTLSLWRSSINKTDLMAKNELVGNIELAAN